MFFFFKCVNAVERDGFVYTLTKQITKEPRKGERERERGEGRSTVDSSFLDSACMP